MKTFGFILLMILSVSAFSKGITSIGNGGGLGELQFIYYFNNTDKILDLCVEIEECKLNQIQTKYGNQFKLDFIKLKDSVNISFEPSVENIWSWKKNNLVISQQWLYQGSLDVLRSNPQIMSLAMALQMSHMYNVDFKSAFYEIEKSLQGLNFYNQSVSSLNRDIQFHWITTGTKNKNTELKLFVLEDKLKSYSLNEVIQKKFPKIDIHTLEVYNVLVGISADSILTVYGYLSGKFDGQYFNQLPFKFTANVNENKLIQSDSIQFFINLE